MSLDLGDPLPNLSVNTFDSSGNLQNAGAVTLTITLPDLTTVTPSVVNSDTGVYTASYVTVQSGLHRIRWEATGVNTSAYRDTAWVSESGFGSILSLAEAKAHLGETSSTIDEELRDFMEAATAAIEAKIGPCVPKTVTKRVRDHACNVLLLPLYPAVSITSVTSVLYPTTTWTASQLDLDGEAGIVRLLSNTPFYNGPWNVTYTVGRPTTLSPKVRHAAKEMLRHLWITQRGQNVDSPLPDFVGDEQFGAATPFGTQFSVPNRVLELLAADQISGIA